MFAFICAAFANEPETAAEYSARAETRLHAAQNAADYLAAHADFDKAIKLAPKNANDYLGRAEAVRHLALFLVSPLNETESGTIGLKSLGLAKSDYSKAIALDSKNPLAYLGRADVAFSLPEADMPAILSDLNRAIELDPKLTMAYYTRAIVRGIGGRPDKNAIFADYDKAIELGFENPKEDKTYRAFYEGNYRSGAFNGRGLIHVLRGENDKALADFSSAIAANIFNIGALVNRGRVFASMEKPSDAIKDFSTAILLKPNDASFYRLRAAELEKLKQPDKAKADRESATAIEAGTFDANVAVPPPPASLESTPTAQDADALASSARQAASSRDYANAIKNYDAALKQRPADAGLLVERGGIRARSGDFSGAFVDFQKAIALQPNFIPAWEQQGVAQEAQAEYSAAAASFAKAIEILQNDADAPGQSTTLAALRLAIVNAVQEKPQVVDEVLSDATAMQLRGALIITDFEIKKHPQNAALLDLRKQMQAELDGLQ